MHIYAYSSIFQYIPAYSSTASQGQFQGQPEGPPEIKVLAALQKRPLEASFH